MNDTCMTFSHSISGLSVSSMLHIGCTTIMLICLSLCSAHLVLNVSTVYLDILCMCVRVFVGGCDKAVAGEEAEKSEHW